MYAAIKSYKVLAQNPYIFNKIDTNMPKSIYFFEKMLGVH